MSNAKRKPDEIKIYARRDSATSLLRKMGVPKEKYGDFIEKLSDGQFSCNVTLAESSTLPWDAPAPTTLKVVKRTQTTTNTKVKDKTKRGEMSRVARELILEGKENAQIWAILKSTFNLDDTKKYYPGWYRAEMRRNGVI